MWRSLLFWAAFITASRFISPPTLQHLWQATLLFIQLASLFTGVAAILYILPRSWHPWMIAASTAKLLMLQIIFQNHINPNDLYHAVQLIAL